MFVEKAKQLEKVIKEKFGSDIVGSEISLGCLVVTLDRDKVRPFFSRLKDDPELNFELLLDVTAVDWLDKRDFRFELVYHLRSFANYYFLRVKVPLSEDHPEVDSLYPLWKAADFLESEVWDMFGIRFKGHPNLRRILMYEEFEGHPLRKDYPVRGKQPRIKLRHPEVTNTAPMMKRPDLVQIRSRSESKLG